jgi:hypothetical protein
MTEIRELLHDLADKPQRSADTTALMTAGRRRRHCRRLASAFVVTTVVVALGAGIFLVVPRSTPGAHIQAGTPASTTVQSGGLGLALPTSWRQLPALTNTSELLVAGTADRPSANSIRACGPNPVNGSAVYIVIYPMVSQPPATINPRPAAFSVGNATVAQNCLASGLLPSAGPTSTPTASSVPTTQASTNLTNHLREYVFAEAGRNLLAQVHAVGDSTGQLLSEGVTVLNTLQVAPTGGPTLPQPTTTTIPRPTGPAPSNPAAARQAIQAAMNSAFDNQGPVPLQDSVQGGYPLGNTSQQAGRNANPSLVGNIIVRINSLQFLNSTHAALNFDLLVNNQPITANTAGSAIVENGQWKLSRDTYCQIIGRGGTISCPLQ